MVNLYIIYALCYMKKSFMWRLQQLFYVKNGRSVHGVDLNLPSQIPQKMCRQPIVV